jgi:hypothetical protein
VFSYPMRCPVIKMFAPSCQGYAVDGMWTVPSLSFSSERC